MFLSLELPGGDKGVSIFVRDLKGEKDYERTRFEQSFDFDSDRVRANSAIRRANEALGQGNHKAFAMLFNQFDWPAITGWEYWSDNYQLMLKHALVVAKTLDLPLHIGADIMDAVLDAALDLGMQVDFSVAKPVEKPDSNEFEYTNRDLVAGKYFLLEVSVYPTDLPEVEAL